MWYAFFPLKISFVTYGNPLPIICGPLLLQMK
jgi:hypothetical protein